jgi:hypothetical protein
MTRPRQYHPGQIAMATRRTVQGQLLLLPDEWTYDIVHYSTALALKASGAELYASYWGPNQTHSILGDPWALRNVYYREVHSKVALVRNRQFGEYPDSPWYGERRGKLWDAQRTNDLKLLDADVVLEKMLYTWLNPVKDGLVDHPDEYEGPMVLPRHLEDKVRAKRPPWWFSPSRPDELVYIPRLPPMLRSMPTSEAIEFLEQLVDAGARAARERREREDRPPALGDRLLEQRPWDYPAVRPPPPQKGRPSKKSRQDPYEAFEPLEFEVERHGQRLSVSLPMPPEYPVLREDEPSPGSGSNPYRVRSMQTKSVQKRQKLKERFPREFPEQINPPRFYASDVERMERAYGSFNKDLKVYEECRIAFKNGNRDVVFPAGTIRLRRDYGVNCSDRIPAPQMPRPPTIQPKP